MVDLQLVSTMSDATISPSKEEEEEEDDDGRHEPCDGRDDNGDDDVEEEEDDDDEGESSSLWHDIREGWRQHCIAILVAILATASMHSFNTGRGIDRPTTAMTMESGESGIKAYSFPTPSLPQPLTMSGQKTTTLKPHGYLDEFTRTANITFCNANLLDLKPRDRLMVMDFHVPLHLIPAMIRHFQADALRDDGYTMVWNPDAPAVQEVQHAEVGCIEQLQKNTKHAFIKGMTFYSIQPTIASMYPGYDEAEEAEQLSSGIQRKKIQAAHLSFTGFAAKFVNLSTKPVLLFWDGRNVENRKLLGEIPAMESLGTATTPGQSFSVTPVYDSEHALARWVITADEPILYYEPEGEPFSRELLSLYEMQKLNQEFAKHYLIASGRAWLGHFPRPFPVHPMWKADFFGQKHILSIEQGSQQPRKLTLTVQSVTPKVFTIANFLSDEECDDLIALALQAGLHRSSVYGGALSNHTRDRATRSSYNTWLARDTTVLTDEIYLRAAQVLQLDPELLQKPIEDDVHPHLHSIAESLQVVRYEKGQEYTAHHDFVYPSQRHRYQPTRYATLLFYLNDNMKGGHTVFPRAVNRSNRDGVRIKPQKGTAVLFYSLLEDGNVDDLSQHASEPVEDGEKFIANLWIWEPMIN